MTSIDEQRQQQQPPSPTVETLQQKIDEFANGIVGLYGIFRDRKKTIIQQLHEIRQLAQDLSIDDMQLRHMISESFTMMGGVSPSWLRKLLPGYLKSTKHTRKDYLELQHQRDQQPLQQQQELVELPSSSTRHPALKQPSDDDDEQTASVTTYDNDNVVVAVKPQTQNKQIAVLEDKDTIIKNLETKIEELQVEIRYLRDGPAAQRRQPQEEETFTALGYLQLYDNDVPIKVTINIKTKSIEDMKIAHEIIHKKIIRTHLAAPSKTYYDSNKQFAFPKHRSFLLYLFYSSILKCSL
jgi:hypothetical protein